MRSWISNHLSYANVTATIALFVALGGTAFAAISLPADSVGTAQLAPGSVTAAKLHAGAAPRTTMFISRIDAVPAGATDFGPVSGSATGIPGNGDGSEQGTPAVPMTARDMHVYTYYSNVTVTLNVGADTASVAPTALTCTTNRAGTCRDTTDRVVIPAGSLVTFTVDNQSGTSVAALVGWVGTRSR